MGNYAVAADVTAYKVNGSVVDLSGYNESEINAKIALVELLIERITNDIFYPLTATYDFDGSGNIRQYFTPKVGYKLVTISSATEVDIEGDTLNTFVENQHFKKHAYFLEMDAGLWSARQRISSYGVWPLGLSNLRIAGTWGLSSVPSDIKEATILLALEYLIPSSTGMLPKDTKRGKWSDFEVEFVGRQSDSLTGYREVDRILEHRINYVSLLTTGVPRGV